MNFDAPTFALTAPSTAQFLTATATDPDGNTSEFSQCLDADGDGIAYNVDCTPGPGVFSNNFDDTPGGTTKGQITSRGVDRT